MQQSSPAKSVIYHLKNTYGFRPTTVWCARPTFHPDVNTTRSSPLHIAPLFPGKIPCPSDPVAPSDPAKATQKEARRPCLPFPFLYFSFLYVSTNHAEQGNGSFINQLLSVDTRSNASSARTCRCSARDAWLFVGSERS